MDDPDPGLPIKLGRCSNGEYVPPPLRPLAIEAMRQARASADDSARRLGMSRRRFLLSSMGAAAGLLTLAACSDDKHSSEGSEPGGTFTLPPESTTEPGAIERTETIIDVQTHLLDYDLVPNAPDFAGGFPFKSCGEDDYKACFGVDHWMEELFLRSDTSMVVLSAIPIVADADPLSIDVMERARAVAKQLCGEGRVLLQGHAVPNVGRREAALDAMSELHEQHPIAAWKVYTHSPGPGWSFTDATGEAFLGRVEEIAAAGGTKIVSVHKGISGGAAAASPADIGPAAAAHPDLRFAVYHSGFEPGNDEGPFNENGKGADRLVKSLRDAGVKLGGNVYAELGTTWRSVMGNPDEAAHLLGKLLVTLGPDNILWGTDSIWYGSPQDQIEAFRSFEITPAFQEQFGYPALTAETKAKIFGGNAARLYGIDAAAVARSRCQFSPDELEAARQESARGNRTFGPETPADVAASFSRDHPWTQAAR